MIETDYLCYTACIFIEKCVLMKTPGFGEKGRTLEWNFKNTEILKNVEFL